MNLAKIRKELDNINAKPMTQEIAYRVWQLEELWSGYNNKDLGEYRTVIEDRLHLAHSRRARAGF